MSKQLRPLLKPSYICSSCRQSQRRSFTASGRLRAAPPPPPPSGATHLTHRGVIAITGQDAAKFLQGLTTNNVDPARRDAWYTGFLNAQGRVLWDAFIYPRNGEHGGDLSYLIDVESEEVEAFMRHLKRHKLRSKVQIRDAREEWNIWSAWRNGNKPNTSKPIANDDMIALRDPRLASLGDRIMLSAKHTSLAKAESGYEALEEAPLSAYTVRRYLQGIPEGQGEILRESALPMESNMDYLNGIDFRKGCYVGQELTIRTQHTGVIRKRILPVQLYDAAATMPAALSYETTEFVVEKPVDIKAQGGKRPAGKLLASVGNIGLALCRLENMTNLRVSAEGGTWKEGTEFSVAGDVKVKAFVPEWLRAREQEKTDRRARKEDPAVE